jgi:hypothetical protein
MEHEVPSPEPETLTMAWFDDVDAVRKAAVELERHGIDAVYIEVARTTSVTDRRRTDRSTMSWLGRRAVVGVVLGLLVGALVGYGLGQLLGADGTDLLGSVIAATVFIAPIGGFLAVVTRIPATDEAFDTFGDEPEGEDWISVSGPPEVQESARQVLAGLGATKVSERGSD